MPSPERTTVIKALGRQYAPLSESGLVTLEIGTSDRVGGWIGLLGSQDSILAKQALSRPREIQGHPEPALYPGRFSLGICAGLESTRSRHYLYTFTTLSYNSCCQMTLFDKWHDSGNEGREGGPG